MYIQTQYLNFQLVDHQNYCKSYASMKFWLENIILIKKFLSFWSYILSQKLSVVLLIQPKDDT